MIKYIGLTKKGGKNSINEDRGLVGDKVLENGSYFGTDNLKTIAVVCDGVGGQESGNNAAESAIAEFKSLKIPDLSPRTVSSCIYRANQRVLDLSDGIKHIATTLSGILVYQNRYISFNVGDTRIYKLTDGTIAQLSTDHVVANDKKLRRQSWLYYFGEKDDILTRFLGGTGTKCAPSIRRGTVTGEEKYFLICSDGIYKYCADQKLKEITFGNMSMEEKGNEMINCALDNGSEDDLSVVLISIT